MITIIHSLTFKSFLNFLNIKCLTFRDYFNSSRKIGNIKTFFSIHAQHFESFRVRLSTINIFCKLKLLSVKAHFSIKICVCDFLHVQSDYICILLIFHSLSGVIILMETFESKISKTKRDHKEDPPLTKNILCIGSMGFLCLINQSVTLYITKYYSI